MYIACLTLPPHLEESDLEKLGPALDGLNTGYYASREIEDDDSSAWLMRWITETHPDLTDFSLRLSIWAEAQDVNVHITPDLWTIEEIDENKDWLAESYQGFQPFEVAEFYIYGSHYEGTLPEDKILLLIDAATAFGSGEHPTTAGCLQALQNLKEENFSPHNILDMGCGSGILAIAAAKLFPNARITAIDIDEEAVTVTKRHQFLNNISDDAIQRAAGDGFNALLCQENKPYDLIIANILAAPLQTMAPALLNNLGKNSYVILSGLLNEQANDVLKPYQELNLQEHKKILEWSTLTLKR